MRPGVKLFLFLLIVEVGTLTVASVIALSMLF